MNLAEFRERIDARAVEVEGDFDTIAEVRASDLMADFVGELLAEGLTVYHVTTRSEQESWDHGVYAREESALAVAQAEAEREREGWQRSYPCDRVSVDRVEQQGRVEFRIVNETPRSAFPCTIVVARRAVTP